MYALRIYYYTKFGFILQLDEGQPAHIKGHKFHLLSIGNQMDMFCKHYHIIIIYF